MILVFHILTARPEPLRSFHTPVRLTTQVQRAKQQKSTMASCCQILPDELSVPGEYNILPVKLHTAFLTLVRQPSSRNQTLCSADTCLGILKRMDKDDESEEKIENNTNTFNDAVVQNFPLRRSENLQHSFPSSESPVHFLGQRHGRENEKRFTRGRSGRTTVTCVSSTDSSYNPETDPPLQVGCHLPRPAVLPGSRARDKILPAYPYLSPIELMGLSGLESLYCLGQLIRDEEFIKAYQLHFLAPHERKGTNIKHLINRIPRNSGFSVSKVSTDTSELPYNPPRAVLYTEGPVLPQSPRLSIRPPNPFPIVPPYAPLSIPQPVLQPPIPSSQRTPRDGPPPGHAFLYTRKRGDTSWTRQPAERGQSAHWAFLRPGRCSDDPIVLEDPPNENENENETKNRTHRYIYDWEQIWGHPLDLSTVSIWVRKIITVPVET